MAVPFYIPDEDAENPSTQPIPLPTQNSPSSPQISPIDNDMIVQAFYEALCRCSQNFPQYTPTPTMSPSSPFNRGGHFWFPSPSTSSVSSPRGSFRGPPRRRLNSYGSQSQYSQQSDQSFEEYDEDLMAWEHHFHQRENLEEFSGQIPKMTKSQKKPKQNSKITTFVISALQFVIDSLK